MIDESWTLGDVLNATAGDCLSRGDGAGFSAVGIDTRRLAPGSVFVAIRGDRYDGHDFLEAAISGGCRAVVIERKKAEGLPLGQWGAAGTACVAVEDTRRALGNLATFHRRRTGVPVAAVTGSNGKTTTKSMAAAILGRHFRTLATKGNLNNDIGLPLTLLDLRPEHRWAVVEMGMNRFGEIARLTEICAPDVGVITNVGPAHLEGLGSLEGVRRAKGELFDGMNENATAVFNAEDPELRRLSIPGRLRALSFGMGEGADLRARGLRTEGSTSAFLLETPKGSAPVELNCPGRHMVYNALAAAAVGHAAGLGPEQIALGLSSFTPVRGRLDLRETPRGIHILDDTYNANPASVKAAVETFRALRGGARGHIVLGDMLELGDAAADLHREVGKAAAESAPCGLYLVGAHAGAAAEGAIAGGMPAGAVETGTREAVLEALAGRLREGDWILVKGSRGMQMERIVASLLAWTGASGRDGGEGAPG